MEKVILKNNNTKVIKAKFINGVFNPLENIEEIKENDIVTIEIKPTLDKWKGILKGVKMGSVELQHKIKNMWK